MKKFLIVLLSGSFLAGCTATKSLVKAEDSKVYTEIDLVNIDQDRVQVTLDPGAFQKEQVQFFIPKTVPGTYSTDNYGQYIEDFRAYDYDGNELSVMKPEVNTWFISSADKLDKISYFVNDT